MRKWLRIIAPIAVLALMPSAAQAATKTGKYVAGTVVASSFNQSVPGVGFVSPLGGTTFTPASTTLTVKIIDVAGSGNPFSACQENPGQAGEVPNLCGDGDDVRWDACATAANQIRAGWVAGRQLAVFFFAADTTCDGTGTTGDYTISG